MNVSFSEVLGIFGKKKCHVPELTLIRMQAVAGEPYKRVRRGQSRGGPCEQAPLHHHLHPLARALYAWRAS